MDDRLNRGASLVEQLSPGFKANLQQNLGVFAPDFAGYTVEIPFGEIYSRPGLDIRSRQIVTISALVTLGTLDQLRVHLGVCRQIGMTGEEVAEILMQLAVYAGWPRALGALGVVPWDVVIV